MASESLSALEAEWHKSGSSERIASELSKLLSYALPEDFCVNLDNLALLLDTFSPKEVARILTKQALEQEKQRVTNR